MSFVSQEGDRESQMYRRQIMKNKMRDEAKLNSFIEHMQKSKGTMPKPQKRIENIKKTRTDSEEEI